jgi:predicted nucleotidyltransferase component of viral defense system
MKISRESLEREAATTGFRAEILEKVIHLFSLLDGFQKHPSLKGRWALKGGTALNLFWFDVPRLSVDIDLNYVGQVEREAMLADRPKIEAGIQAVCSREGFTVARVPSEHAGGKWRLRYESGIGSGGNLEVDVNFMLRLPLWPVIARDSRKLGSNQVTNVPVLDLHELAAGKLAALLSRHASRDLYDAHQLLTQAVLEPTRLRLAFVVYGAMNRKDWRTVTANDVGFAPAEVERELLPTLRRDAVDFRGREVSVSAMIEETRTALGVVLPLNGSEHGFLDAVLERGEIKPEMLTTDAGLADRIRRQPMLEWKARHAQSKQ